jgi:hypothetical protein
MIDSNTKQIVTPTHDLIQRPDYDAEPVEATLIADGLNFEDLVVETGKTTLVLSCQAAANPWSQFGKTVTKQGPSIENREWVTRNIEKLEELQ